MHKVHFNKHPQFAAITGYQCLKNIDHAILSFKIEYPFLISGGMDIDIVFVYTL